MPKLRVGKFVQASRRADTEITPHVFTAAEVELLHCARTGFEALQMRTSRWHSLRHSAGWRLCRWMDFADTAELYLIRVLAGNSGGDHVTPRARNAVWILKANEVVAPWSFSIKHPDVFNSVQGDAHCDLEKKKIKNVRSSVSL